MAVRRIILSSALSLLLVALPLKAQAATGLTIQPIRQELTLDPGQTINNNLLVTNNTNQAQMVFTSTETFNVINENYDYSFSKNENASQWVSYDSPSSVIKPGESHTFKYSLAIPNNAEPGERYIAIFASVNRSSEGSDITSRAGELLYITINGNITRRGNVLDLQFPVVSTKNNLVWKSRIQNEGSAHFSSQITANVFSIFGTALTQTEQQHLLLPHTTRSITGDVKLGKWPGLYRVQFKIGRGDSPAQLQTKWVLYAPIWSIVALLIAVIFLVDYLIKRRGRRSLRLRHRRIHNRR